MYKNNFLSTFQGLYDIHIQMTGVPIMAWEAPPLSNNIYASEVSLFRTLVKGRASWVMFEDQNALPDEGIGILFSLYWTSWS